MRGLFFLRMRKINTDLSDYINSFSIKLLIDQVDSLNEDSEISWNSFGGSVYAGQKFIDYLNTKENKLNANITGIVASMGTAILPFFDKVKGSKQSDIMIHSATGGAKSTLKRTNEFLYQALAKKIDEVKFKEVTGKELKTVMLAEDDERVDVWITGEQAGYIGLFDETYDLLDKAAYLKDKVNIKELDYTLPDNLAIKYGFKQNKLEINNSNNMELKDITIDMLKNNNVDIYNAIFEKGKKAEQERVAEIMEYAENDMEKANSIIKSGSELTKKDVAHFIEKKFSKKNITDLEDGSEEAIKAAKITKDSIEKTVEEKEKENSVNELRRILKTDDLIESETKK